VAAIAGRPDRLFRLHTADFDESFEFEAERLPAERPPWTAYLIGVVMELRRDGYDIPGKDILVSGNVPIGSGLSSSAALEIAVATALERLDGLEIGDAEMINACRRADHNFVGVKSGPMDQFAARACRAGHAGLLDCRTLDMSNHRLPPNIDIFSIYSGMPRSLADGADYNERFESCRRATEILQREHPEIRALRDADRDTVESARELLGNLVYRRAKHVVDEQTRVFDMVEAFGEGDLGRIGEILLAGHESLGANFDVSLPILDEMIFWLVRMDGVVGARLTGAGFGGSMICLAGAGAVDQGELANEFEREFAGRTAEAPQVWRVEAVDGAKYIPGLPG
jgi:galactokinase